jgi:hypothetical protein
MFDYIAFADDVEVLGHVQQMLNEVHAKLFTYNRGEMAERLKAAVC